MGDAERVLLLGVGLGVLWGIAKVAAAAWRAHAKTTPTPLDDAAAKRFDEVLGDKPPEVKR